MDYTTNFSMKLPKRGVDMVKVDDLNDNTEDIDTLIHQNRTMIAPAFDSTKAYVIGDPVVYLGELFVFIADKAAGAWDATKVEPTTAAEMGGGGTEVVANPSGTATAELTKIDIGGTKYNTNDATARTQLNAMKTGFDGAVYSSPAAMVQGCDEVVFDTMNSIVDMESQETDEKLNTIATFTKHSNVLPLTDLEVGLLSNLTGEIDTTREYYRTSRFIPVEQAAYYVDCLINSTSHADQVTIAGYDEFFNFVTGSGQQANTPFNFTINNLSVKYIRACCANTRMTGILTNYNVIIAKGTAPTSYVPYGYDVELQLVSGQYGSATGRAVTQGFFTSKVQPIDEYSGIQKTAVTITEGGNGFVMSNGSYNDVSTSYRRSQPVHFNAGDVIYITAAGRTDGGMALIGIVRNGKNSTIIYDPRIMPTSTTVNTHRYIVEYDCYIVFSWTNSSGITVQKIESNLITAVADYTSKARFPLSRLNDSKAFIRCFKNITCIGDSLTQGIFNVTTGQNQVPLPEYSYPTFLTKITGVPTINLGIGSMCASTEQTNDSWFDRAGTLGYLTADNVGDAVIIALGTNDVTTYTEFKGNVDTDIDLTDRTNNAHNSVGGYANIIQWCREQKPKCMIFLVTISNVRNNYTAAIPYRTAANEKIRAIAAKFDNCYVVDVAQYCETTLAEQTFWTDTYITGSHNNALGYEMRARQTSTLIDYIIENNIDAFRKIQFIDTEYDYQYS